jgi:aldehyde:ferredoxin oxidoreductase
MAGDIPGGYNGKILRVNLSTGRIAEEALDPLVCRRYIGGAGFVAYYLWKELKPGIDALSPENKLIFALGPVSGLLLPGASRNCVGAKSPLSKGIAKSEGGGYWMAELKRAGFDAIIVEGKADHPEYLWIHDGKAEIKDARHLWGKETKETQEAIRSELGDEHIQFTLIGPAGENLVRFACIMNGLHNAAGRGGLGAVMGSKNLKAIAARGHTLPPIADPEKFKAIRQQMTHPYPQSLYGTGGPEMINMEKAGDLTIRNFRDGIFPEVVNIHGGVLKDTLSVGMEGCFACPVRCKKVVKVDSPYHVDPAYGGPEYEALASMGSNCGISDLKAICKGNERCSAYSLDVISTGSVISFAIECFEKGLLTKKDTGGLELKWGDADLMLKLVDLIAKREGFGNFLAEGTARMSRQIGKGSEEFAMHVKGLEAPMHDPRTASGLYMNYMISPNGADHGHSEPDFVMEVPPVFKAYHPLGYLTPAGQNDLSPAKIGMYRMSELKTAVYDSLVLCAFMDRDYEQLVDLVKAVTGWDTGIPEILRIGERILTLMRLFNMREGMSDKDDVLPARYYGPTNGGSLADYKATSSMYDRNRRFYYALMGWDQHGIPLPEKVEELEIG